MYGHWCVPFWRSGWNVFDFVVVVVGMLSVARLPLPGPLSLLRMLRAFRVFRLFKRIKSLNKIIVSLGNAVPGIVNAAFVMLLVMCIYAILGVEFFGTMGRGGNYMNAADAEVDSLTSRMIVYGDEYWSTFTASLLTLFQVLTGESWAEAIARPLLFKKYDTVFEQIGVALYFISFIILNGIVLINVVVAVLLEKCIAPPEEDEDAEGCTQEGLHEHEPPLEHEEHEEHEEHALAHDSNAAEPSSIGHIKSNGNQPSAVTSEERVSSADLTLADRQLAGRSAVIATPLDTCSTQSSPWTGESQAEGASSRRSPDELAVVSMQNEMDCIKRSLAQVLKALEAQSIQLKSLSESIQAANASKPRTPLKPRSSSLREDKDDEPVTASASTPSDVRVQRC
eukprot:CAMPEP_0119314838 /NCGR_PEP_ID=MMETSP1333-20130426/34057_1 /TAXON_ID=418940 /ORGANISM="Scyphosphaera apsteinii, Strain RCC1455" /LENGTH=395 /DNA_ID=CAMNT_0007320037 /DNA_START=476 /DNA_END=1663 /DNA_ORIENTATION=+